MQQQLSDMNAEEKEMMHRLTVQTDRIGAQFREFLQKSKLTPNEALALYGAVTRTLLDVLVDKYLSSMPAMPSILQKEVERMGGQKAVRAILANSLLDRAEHVLPVSNFLGDLVRVFSTMSRRVEDVPMDEFMLAADVVVSK